VIFLFALCAGLNEVLYSQISIDLVQNGNFSSSYGPQSCDANSIPGGAIPTYLNNWVNAKGDASSHAYGSYDYYDLNYAQNVGFCFGTPGPSFKWTYLTLPPLIYPYFIGMLGTGSHIANPTTEQVSELLSGALRTTAGYSYTLTMTFAYTTVPGHPSPSNTQLNFSFTENTDKWYQPEKDFFGFSTGNDRFDLYKYGQFNLNGVPPDTWVTRSVTFSISSNDNKMKNMVIWPDDGNSFCYFYIANVSLVENIPVCDCPANITYTNTDLMPHLTEASNSITGGAGATVKAGQNVIFQAGKVINLQPGFTIQKGANFNKSFAPCDNYNLNPFAPTLDFIPDVYCICPGTNFVIFTTGVSSWTFSVSFEEAEVGTPGIYYNGGSANGGGDEPIIIWDGSLNAGGRVPASSVVTYKLTLYGYCGGSTLIERNITIYPCGGCGDVGPYNSRIKSHSSGDSSNISNQNDSLLSLLNIKNNVNSDSSGIKIYPNPNNGTISVEFNLQQYSQISEEFKLFNLTGQIVFNQLLTSVNSTLDLSGNGIANGMYYYEIISNNQSIKQGKLVVIK
jgi:hypothetical protein